MHRWLAAPLVAAALLVTAVPATADSGAAPSGTLLLAVEGGGTGTVTGESPAQGPEPAGPDASGNPAAPENYEPPFLWTASIALLGAMVLLAVVVGGLYYLMVYRPSHREAG